MRTRDLAILAGLALAAPAAHAQADRFVLADRGNNALVTLWDLDNDGLIDEPTEQRLFFSGANAAGTMALNNPNAIAATFGGRVVIGDQANRNIYIVEDLNKDGDALDLGESRVVADATGASGLSFSFPTGIAIDAFGDIFVANAGNSFGNDAVFKFRDLNADGDFQDAGEAVEVLGVPAFGAPNGPYAPQEIAFLPTAVVTIGILRNSSAGLHGIYLFRDLNGNGRYDDAGEFVPYFDATNASGITLSAGFALEIDQAHTVSVYTHQIASGGTDQLIRTTDLNGDLDANDADEARIVFSSAETGLSVIDVLSLPDGRVLLTNNSSPFTVIALSDNDNNGDFMGAGERTMYYGNTLAAIAGSRGVARMPAICQANCDESTSTPILNVLDFNCFLNRFNAGDPYANCDSSTVEPVLNVLDFNCFLNAFAAGCP